MESITHEDASEGQVALERLPAEVLESIFMWLTPQSLLTIRRVSRLLYGIVKGNQSLHRDVYLLRMVSLPSETLIVKTAAALVLSVRALPGSNSKLTKDPGSTGDHGSGLGS